MSSFAYLYERFPSFVQTFVYREAMEMVRQGMDPRLISIRQALNSLNEVGDVGAQIWYLPEQYELRVSIDTLRQTHQLKRTIRKAIREARKKKDSNRVFEAAWLGPQLQLEGIRHVHAHFGGMAARTAWWLRKLYGITYSFTGHANDIFCDTDLPISNGELVRSAKFVVTETDYAKTWMEKKHPHSAGKIFRIYNGIDRDFPPRQLEGLAGLADAPFQILSVGRYVEKKGFGDLIEACRLLHQKGRHFHCQIIGEGPLQAELEMRIEQAGLQGIVQLLGARSQSEVRELLAKTHLFVLACVPDSSGGSDNLPTVIMEAMMCGTPVVSTHIAGIPEMIEHGKSGLLVAPHAPKALADAMEQLLRDPALAGQFSARGRDNAIAKFSIENTTRLLKHLLVKKAGIKPPQEAFGVDPSLPSGWLSRWFGAKIV